MWKGIFTGYDGDSSNDDVAFEGDSYQTVLAQLPLIILTCSKLCEKDYVEG